MNPEFLVWWNNVSVLEASLYVVASIIVYSPVIIFPIAMLIGIFFHEYRGGESPSASSDTGGCF